MTQETTDEIENPEFTGEEGRKPSVTFCIPSFNRSDLVGETLDSILAQTDPRWEALVVDDGSTDESMRIIGEYAARDSRIRLMLREREPKGACACRNIAVDHARGRYVMFLDTDDLVAPWCVEQRVAVMEANPEADFSIFSMLLFKNSIDDADRLWNIDSEEDDLLRVLRLDPICQGTGTLWRRESFVRAGMWDESLRLWQDIELHVRAFSGEFNYVKRLDLPPDVYIRETDSSLSRGSYQSLEKIESRAEVARRAVSTLRKSGRGPLVPEVRFFCSSVIIGAIGANHFDLARSMREWGRREGVLSGREAFRLMLLEATRRSRLDRVPIFGKLRGIVASDFSTESTLGEIRVARSPSLA